MPTLSPFMIDDHRNCDALLATLESQVQALQWDEAKVSWSRFVATMRCHFAREEELLFPAFEQASGNTAGPTAVMRMEHEQMRALFEQLDEAVQGRNHQRFLDLSESMMILIQQHNMKEEQILYAMCDQVIPNVQELLEKITARQPEGV